MTNGQTAGDPLVRATVGFAPGNTVISTGQTAGDPLVRTTFGSAFTLDGVGNRTKVDFNEPMMPSYNAETIAYTYSSGNILASADGNAYTHDANGNRTTKTNGTNVTSYTYDSLNRLTQTGTTSRQIQYLYNGLGQRVGKIDNGVQTNYLVDPNGLLPQILAETDASNNLISFYVYDGGGLVAKITPDNKYYFYHYDGLGSTVAITDSNANVVNTYCYSPEGLVGTQETIPNPFTYVGRFGVMAEGNGLYYMRARYYDPEVGRFVTKDPIGYRGDSNLYGYVANNIINIIDPWGLVDLNLFAPSDAAYKGASAVQSPPNIFTVGAHGSPMRVIDQQGITLTPQQLATIIRNHPTYKAGMIVRLMACNTGVSPGSGRQSYGEQLANALGANVNVEAAASFVWYYQNGTTVVAPPIGGGNWQYYTNLQNGPDLNNQLGYNMFTGGSK